ncbi:MAG TPA: tRNA lysidine(34) synthetase TilS, partial [Bryobacteraceae bacterium]|nr:tRNA lysidine(34) synthetase TilS [Bryobacteraceae bacterium]
MILALQASPLQWRSLLDRVSGTLSRYSMCSAGDHVTVAVSGGADSVCLLHILHELAPSLGIELSVAHLNHKLRGMESDGDAEFVRDLAKTMGLSFFYDEVNVLDLGGNLEQAGRDARLAFFRGLPASKIATGHTRSDQAETVIYRLLRGSGTAGLAGILPVAADRRIRPLIDCSRAEVLEYLRSRGLLWREDRSNADLRFARNRIRHEFLPILGPAAETALARTAELARDEEEYWTAEIERLAGDLFTRRPPAILINVDNLYKVPVAVSRRLIRRAISEVKGDLRQIDLFHVDSILALAVEPEGHGRRQAPGIDVFRSFEWLKICLPRSESRWERDYCTPLPIPGEVKVPGQSSKVRVEVAENTNTVMADEGYNTGGGLIDAQWLFGPVELRNWHPGDRFTRPGHANEKIKSLFQVARIP